MFYLFVHVSLGYLVRDNTCNKQIRINLHIKIKLEVVLPPDEPEHISLYHYKKNSRNLTCSYDQNLSLWSKFP